MGRNSAKDGVHTVAKWISFIACCATIVLGVVHLIEMEARIKWPKNDIVADVQYSTWRMRGFTFAPDLFIDNWTPFAMGLVGALAHIKGFKSFQRLYKTFAYMFIYLFLMAMYGNLGYNSGLGIIVAAITLLADLFALIAFILDTDAHASLDLDIGLKN